MLGLRLVDLLDADDVGVQLTHNLSNAPEADSPVEASASGDVVATRTTHAGAPREVAFGRRPRRKVL
jgi:hypothetical protein